MRVLAFGKAPRREGREGGETDRVCCSGIHTIVQSPTQPLVFSQRKFRSYAAKREEAVLHCLSLRNAPTWPSSTRETIPVLTLKSDQKHSSATRKKSLAKKKRLKRDDIRRGRTRCWSAWGAKFAYGFLVSTCGTYFCRGVGNFPTNLTYKGILQSSNRGTRRCSDRYLLDSQISDKSHRVWRQTDHSIKLQVQYSK